MGRKGGGFYVRIVKSTGRRYMYDQVDVRASGGSRFSAPASRGGGRDHTGHPKLRDSLIIGVQNERVALGKEIADRIQV